MLLLALTAGILLLVFSRLFAIKKDPREKAVRECLPGVNCGACGYKGCDDYAAAIVESGAAASLCVPGGQKVADELCEIMGIEKETVKDVIAFVPCNGNCESTTRTAEYEGVETCRGAAMLYGGTKSCRFACLGLGDCAAVCPSGAICMADGIAHIDTSRCIGCGLCKKTCPKQIIEMLPRSAKTAVRCMNKQKGADARKACTSACIGCKKCEKACSAGAVTVKDNLAVIDYNKCTYCALCVDECPTGALKKVYFPSLSADCDVTELDD